MRPPAVPHLQKALHAAVPVALALILVACSRPVPPTGRWEGAYESPTTIIAAWLEIGQTGLIRVSAPNSSNMPPDTTPADRQSIREDMIARLASGWGGVEPRKMDFDGKTFRMPGGIAPQMKWDAQTKQMTLILYLGAHPALSVPLRKVEDFSDNPFVRK